MSNQFTYRNRKKKRHLQHKKLSDSFNKYLHSGVYKTDFTTALKRIIKKQEQKRF